MGGLGILSIYLCRRCGRRVQFAVGVCTWGKSSPSADPGTTGPFITILACRSSRSSRSRLLLFDLSCGLWSFW